jgi:hypothetical protein
MRPRALVVAALSVLTGAAPLAQRPALHTLLAAYLHAQGAWTPIRPRTRALHWSVTQGSVTGSETALFSGDDYRIDRAVGGRQTAEGSFEGYVWSQTQAGAVSSEPGIEERIAADERALRNALAQHDERAAGIRISGDVRQPFDAYIIAVDPQAGARELLYVDKSTSLLDERVLWYRGERVVFTYGDYRTTLGLTFAWHVRETVEGAATIDMRLQDVQIGDPVDRALLAPPTSPR